MVKAWRRARPETTAASPAETAGDLTTAAVRSLSLGDTAGFRRLVAELSGRPGMPSWRIAVRRCLADRLRQGIANAWERGWQPADVVRFTSRRYTTRHGRLATDTIAAGMRADPSTTVDGRWREQLDVLKAEVWWGGEEEHPDAWCQREGADFAVYVACAIELLHLLEGLPRLPNLGPPPGTPRAGTSSRGSTDDRGTTNTSRHKTDASGAGTSGGGTSRTGTSGTRASEYGNAAPGRRVREVDKRTLGRVRALLAKAESTDFPEEAEALSARAQELMARHSIDDALLAAETGDTGGPGGRRIAVDSPYESRKAVLLTVVADANRCRAVWHRELGFSTVVGYPADLAAVEMLFTSLLVQATAAMVQAGPRRDARGRSRTRSFRHAFLNAYAARIGERLREAAGRAAADAGGNVLVPVLAARDQAVEREVGAMFPNLARGRAGSVSNYEGWVAGRLAADLASLDGRHEVTGAHRRS